MQLKVKIYITKDTFVKQSKLSLVSIQDNNCNFIQIKLFFRHLYVFEINHVKFNHFIENW